MQVVTEAALLRSRTSLTRPASGLKVRWQCVSISSIFLSDECVFVVFYFWSAFLGQDYCNDIEAVWAIVNIISSEKISGGACHPLSFWGGDDFFYWCEGLIFAGLYFDEDDGTRGIDHNQVNFAGPAGVVAGQVFESGFGEEFSATFFTPRTEQLSVGEQFASV